MKVPVQKANLREVDAEIAQEAYKEYAAKYGPDQSFERLHERGGFCWAELADHLYARIKRLERQA